MIQITFEKERETKNAVRYAEQYEGERGIVGTLYLLKSAAEELGNPDKIVVSVEAEGKPALKVATKKTA